MPNVTDELSPERGATGAPAAGVTRSWVKLHRVVRHPNFLGVSAIRLLQFKSALRLISQCDLLRIPLLFDEIATNHPQKRCHN